MPTIRSIRAPVVHEAPKVKGSRFIAAAAPVADRAAAEAFVARRRAAEPRATHHAFAYRLAGDLDACRASDDGEPSGTAGRPILEQIDGRDLRGVAVVVSRHFGGVKLGTGGLVRAYGAAAGEALAAAEVATARETEALHIRFAYPRASAVDRVLAAFDLTPAAADCGAGVAHTLAVPIEDADRLCRDLVDATAGEIEIERPR